MKFPFVILILLLLFSCTQETENENADAESAVISILARAVASINTDASGDDRVRELRMIVFDQTGKAVFNNLLNFPNGFENRSAAVKLRPGIYDFYFFANESVSTAFASALVNVANISAFASDVRFSQLRYKPDFQPQNDYFLMSAIYKRVRLTRGGTELSPLPLSLSTPKVELIRALAKVEIVFRKKTSGIEIPSASRISTVQLQKIAQNYSVPPADNFYTGNIDVSQTVNPDFDYSNDSLGAVEFFVPEFLVQSGATNFTELHINNRSFPILTDNLQSGLTVQRRTIASLSSNSIVRNFHYIINAYIDAEGGIWLQTCIKEWNKSAYAYMFQDDRTIVIPPVVPTDSSVIVPTNCGKIEIRSANEYLQQGLMGAFGDKVNWWDPVLQAPTIIPGNECYCEKKYGEGWRFINACELMSFLALFDQTYKIWHSNTDQAATSHLPFYTLEFRQQAHILLQKLVGEQTMSAYLYPTTDARKDAYGAAKLGVIDAFFTPGDIVVRLKDYPNGWIFPSPPAPGIENWYPMEVVHQVKGYWYAGYLDYTNPANYNNILYQRFERYSFSSTVSRCVREVK